MNNPVNKWAKILNRHLTKDGIQIAKKVYKEMINGISLVVQW